jgi:hypothetical protein
MTAATVPAPDRHPDGRGSRFWEGLGSARTVRVIFIGMIVYFVVIGMLVFGYAKVQTCLAQYSNESAAATKMRVQLAADDRVLNQRIEAVDDSDRARIIADQKATRDLLVAVNKNGRATRQDIDNFLATSNGSIKIFSTNERERQSIAEERARIDAARAQAAPPPAPKERC